MLASGSRHPSEPPKTIVVQPKTTEVLVAKVNLSRAQVIGEQDIGWADWPIAAANPTLIQKTGRPDAVHQFVGAMVRVPLASGEPIHEAGVVFAKNGGFTAAIVKPGMRAVAMDISPDTGVLPEDRVDVILTPSRRTADQQNFISVTILSDVRVLAATQKSATLELTPRQAETFAAARASGTLSLTLRSFADSQSPDQGGNTNDPPRSITVVRYGVTSGGSWW